MAQNNKICVSSEYKETTRLSILNVHNPAAIFVFYCNTNVQVSEIDHIYYTTVYGSKSTQKEDTRSFINGINALARRINKKVQENDSETPDSH